VNAGRQVGVIADVKELAVATIVGVGAKGGTQELLALHKHERDGVDIGGQGFHVLVQEEHMLAIYACPVEGEQQVRAFGRKPYNGGEISRYQDDAPGAASVLLP
jgi:hypothetical protein